MSTRLRELIDRLHGQNIHPTGKELADVLWLALRMGELEAARTTPEQADGQEVPSISPIDQPVGPAPPSQSETGIVTGTPVEEQRVPLYVESSTSATRTTEEGPGVGARPFRAPAVPALPDSLALSRALRPLMRKVSSRSRRVLDETTTAERYADWRLWLPVFKGQPERWLELALVIDASPSLSLWHPTLTELYRLLARHGAFRDVRRWHLGIDAQGKPVLSKGLTATPRRPEELLHPEGRRLVIVVSDYAAPPWYTGVYDRWLRLWSQTQPLALLHLLPPRFWLRGGLQRTRLAQFHALAPGLPNPQLLADVAVFAQSPHPNPPPQEGRKLLQAPEPVFLPVFTLEPESVALWARLLAGSGETRSPGVVLDRTVVSKPPASGQEITVQERLRYFRSSASPEAQTLARYCAALPLTLAVMRLLQVEMLPHSHQVHLAEVFFSGLLLRRNPEEKNPEQFLYDFRPELREKLLDTLRAPLILDIHQRLSDAVRRNLGRIADFPAFIPDLLTEGGLRLDERSLPFAEVGVTVLRRLGGRYVERAERLSVEIERLRAAAAARLATTSTTPVTRPAEPKLPLEPTSPTPFRDRFRDGKTQGPEMVWLPGGTFTMGDDKRGLGSEKPAHPVTLSHFAVGKYPVTFEEYDAFCDATGREKPDDRGWGRGRRPVIYVSWDDAQAYCQWLSQQTGQDYRLLTEAQWEYACRAGSDTAWCFGDDERQLSRYAWYGEDWQKGSTHPVGDKRANAWGLHDLHGNVWEWVQDWYGDYSSEPQHNPSGPESGAPRVIRGGGWVSVAGYCRSAYRVGYDPADRLSNLGFRLARTGPLSSYPFTLPPPKPEPPLEPKEPIADLRDKLRDKSLGPKMAWLPGGKFRMGDDNGYEREKPVHEVAVSAFSIGQYPVTFEEYDKFCEATHKKKPDDRNWGRGTRPVINISWEDARAYCEWLSQQTGEDYRLLTEAEWEYACRATSSTRYCYGDDEQRLGEYAWYSKNSEVKTHPVGEKKPNAWQLYDMHGNVWEWVQDWYADDYYKRSPRENPSGPESGADRVVRGGGWLHGAVSCRSAFRDGFGPADRDDDLGFRLARTGAWPLAALTLGRRQVEESPVSPPRYPPYQGFQDHLKDKTAAPEMVYLPGGTFKMGDIQGKGYEWERPVHEVALDAFAIGRYPVTVGEFRRFVDATGYRTDAEREDGAYVWDGKNWGKKADASWRNPYFSQEDRHPVVCVSWHDASAYCEWLSEQTGERYSLPSEAEWEYACRASSETTYFFGDDEGLLEQYAWYSKNSEGRTQPVGEKRANPWDLYDITGNVWEWVRDWYGEYSSEPQHNPSGPETGAFRVLRGGDWFCDAVDCRSAYRAWFGPAFRLNNLGFRLARRV